MSDEKPTGAWNSKLCASKRAVIETGTTALQSAAAPKTGEQANMPDFFSAEARSGAEVPPQLLAFGGITALGVFALLVFLVLS